MAGKNRKQGKQSQTRRDKTPPRSLTQDRNAKGKLKGPGIKVARTTRPIKKHGDESDTDNDDGPQLTSTRMSHWIEFTPKEQKDIVHEELSMFGSRDNPWQALVVKSDANMYTYKRGDFTSIYLLPRDGKDRFKGLMGNPGLAHFGLFMGFIKPDQFNLSLECACVLARAGGVTKNWVKVTEEAEKSFLYGQDLKKEHLLTTSPGGLIHDRGICIVLNINDECLGIAQLNAEDPTFNSANDGDMVLKNVVDLGIYLRAQDKI